jgi:hypothetical protein
VSTATLRRVVVGGAATAVAASAVLLSSATAQADDINTVIDDYLFSKSLSEFSSIRSDQPYPDQLDWSSDACSWSPDKPLGYNFTPACHRHDFGYRNYKRQGRFNETTRAAIDSNFKSDMYTLCDGAWACNRAADVYYAAVRQFGAS